MFLAESLPDFSRELTDLLIAAREPLLAAQVRSLEIVRIGDSHRNAGELDLSKTAGVTAVPGNLVVGDGTGADVVKKVVKAGDIIIIPAGVPHGWTDIADHVDYLSIRPSARVLEAGYVNPVLAK